jgi:hypothetical protein
VLVKFSNNVATALTAGITDSATSFDLDDVTDLPTIISGEHFYLSIMSGGNGEIIKVTGVSGNTITCTRAQDGTSAAAGLLGDVVELRITSAMLLDAFQELTDLAPALHFNWDETTADADQGAGLVSGNNATFSSSTVLYITDEDANGVDVSARTSAWGDFAGTGTGVRGTIVIRSTDNPTTRYTAFNIIGALTDGTGYWKYPVASVYSAGTLIEGEAITVEFMQGPAAASSATVAGIVELLTDAEAITGTDTARAMTAAAFRAALVDGNDTTLGKFNIKDAAWVVNNIGSSGGGTQSIDLSLGNVHQVTVDTSANTFTFDNPSPTANACWFAMEITNGGSQTITWPGTLKWAGTTPPTLTTAGIDIITIYTLDAGTSYHGAIFSTDSSI